MENINAEQQENFPINSFQELSSQLLVLFGMAGKAAYFNKSSKKSYKLFEMGMS